MSDQPKYPPFMRRYVGPPAPRLDLFEKPLDELLEMQAAIQGHIDTCQGELDALKDKHDATEKALVDAQAQVAALGDQHSVNGAEAQAITDKMLVHQRELIDVDGAVGRAEDNKAL